MGIKAVDWCRLPLIKCPAYRGIKGLIRLFFLNINHHDLICKIALSNGQSHRGTYIAAGANYRNFHNIQ